MEENKKPNELINHMNKLVDTQHAINQCVVLCHTASKSKGWWNNLITGEPLKIEDVANTKLLLMHSELSEAVEGLRKNKMDDHLPHRPSVEVELADLLIRVFDFAGAMGLDLGGAVEEKLLYNMDRADHKPENRAKDGGKKF